MSMVQEFRQAFRSLTKHPWSVLVAILTLALGIGASSAIVSLGDALLLRPLPYADADRLVALRFSRLSATPEAGLASPLDLTDWQTRTTSFEAIAGYRWRTVDLTGGVSSERIHGLAVTPEFFKVFGITHVNGRSFLPRDRGTNAIVLSRGVWERRFAGNGAAIGSVVDVNVINLSRPGATPYVTLGVVDEEVHFPPLTSGVRGDVAVTSMAPGSMDEYVDFWIPVFPLAQAKRDDRTLDAVAKLRSGVTIEQAQAEMNVVSRALADAYPDTDRDWTVRVVALRSHVLGTTRRVVFMLMLATVLVFIVAVGNVSTLLLTAAMARQPEVALRVALGASRFRIAMHFVCESLIIALAAAALGVAVMSVGVRLLAPWFPADVPLLRGLGASRFVLVMTTALAIGAACLTGLVPTWTSIAGASGAMRNTQRQSAGRRHNRMINLLVASQVALTMVLIVTTGLLFKSAVRLLAVDPGFNSHNVLTMTMSLPNNKFDWQHNVVFCRDVVHEVEMNPLVSGAAVVQGVPMRPGGFWSTFSVEGAPPPDPGNLPVARHRVVSPDYFRVMRIALLEGRDFDERDGIGELGRPKFVIVNHALAARYWPGQSALGRRLNVGRVGTIGVVTIVGVVADVRYAGLDKESELEVYLPEMMFPQSAITLVVKTTTNPSRLVADIRSRIARVDREAFVTDVRTMDQLIGDSLASRWFATMMLAVCAALGLLLAVSGIFATAAQIVVQRRFEIGVRLALGATQRGVVRSMLQRAVSPVVAGSAVGLGATVAAARLLSSMLFATQPLDPVTFVEAAALFLAVSAMAAYVPARRASKVDPLITLKCE